MRKMQHPARCTIRDAQTRHRWRRHRADLAQSPDELRTLEKLSRKVARDRGDDDRRAVGKLRAIPSSLPTSIERRNVAIQLLELTHFGVGVAHEWGEGIRWRVR